MNLLYPMVIAVAFAIGAVAGFVHYRFFEPATIHCPPESTEKRCVRLRKMVERITAMTPEQVRAEQAAESR